LFLCIVMALAAPTTRAAEEPLTLGVFPRYKATETVTMYTPLAQHLGERLGRKVVLVTSRDFESFWKELSDRKYDIVHFNQNHYARSAQSYSVIAHSQEFGRSAIAGALFVRKDSGIKELSQLRGRTIIFGGGKDAMMSYIAPMSLLMQGRRRRYPHRSARSEKCHKDRGDRSARGDRAPALSPMGR
jgi:phosphonate transport system substrate-binding protein